MNLQMFKYLFITTLLVSNITASKIITVAGLIVPAAIVLYPLTFLFTDVVSEVEGKDSARKLVMTGFYMSLVMVFFIFIARILPAARFWDHQESFNIILGSTPRIVFASMVAYLISQNHDVWAFHWWRERTGGKHLWMRNCFSTMVSQLIDSALFIGLAFGGVYPLSTIAIMIAGQYLIKVIIAVLDTPFCYLLVRVYGKTA